MSYYELKNNKISIGIDSHGAELKSLKRLSDGREYLWCGDAKYWGRTSPVLFPFVGSLHEKTYRVNGTSYPMTQHGFARDMEFTRLSETDDTIWFSLSSDAETLKKYPFPFVLKLGYRIEDTTVTVLWEVENPADQPLYFSIGGHPAFNCPIQEGTDWSDYSLSFGENAPDELVSTRINEQGLATGCMDVYHLQDGHLPLTANLFEHDALVIEEQQTDTVSLCHKDGTPYLTVTMGDALLFGIWSPPGKNAPFVCIEPWHGRCDSEYFDGDLSERDYEIKLDAGERFQTSYMITI